MMRTTYAELRPLGYYGYFLAKIQKLTKKELFEEAIKASDDYTHSIEVAYSIEWEAFQEVYLKIMRLFQAEIKRRGLEMEYDDYSLCGGEWDE